MAKYCLKKPSKRMACAKRFKIEKKVRDHNKKLKREAKKTGAGKRKKGEKAISVPNKCPFKEEILLEAERVREQIETAKKDRKEAAKQVRAEGAAQKRKLDTSATAGLEGLSAKAAKRGEEFTRKTAMGKEESAMGEMTDKTIKTYASEVRKTIETADIVIEVLDARDPLGSRSASVEESVLKGGKRLVLLLNKIDLVPKENVQKWLAYLRTQMPTIAFKASTQEQNQKLGRISGASMNLNSAKCVGADLVMKLLGNYCRNKDIKTSIRVGVVGYPNVGKSSVINSLKRKRACNVGALPGITKQIQEIDLDKHIRLLDSPGVVLAANSKLDAIEIALKNAVRVENLSDPVAPVQAILRRCSRETLMLHYGIAQFENSEQFLAFVARKLGRLKKGARPDFNAAAKHVLNDWNSGKLRYYTEPPETVVTEVNPELCTAELVSEFSKEFDLDALDEDQKIIVEGLPSSSAMDTDLLYKPSIALEVEEEEGDGDDEKMEDDGETSSKGRTVLISAPKKKSGGDDEEKVENNFPESLEISGNVQLNRAIKKAVKRQKKKNKKFVQRTDKLADSMDMTTLGGGKQEDFDFEAMQ